MNTSSSPIETEKPTSTVGKIARVAIDTSVLGRTKTGTAVYVNNLIRAIQSIHPGDLEVIPVRGPDPNPGKKTLFRALNLASELLWLHVRLPRFLKKRNIDLLHMPAMTSPLYSSCPVVVTIHDAHFITHPQARDQLWLTYFRLAVRATVKRASLLLADSKAAALELEKHLGADREKIRVVYLGATRREILPADEQFGLEYAPFLLYTGATMLHKNVHTLVEAFAGLVRQPAFSQYNLIIAGVPAEGHNLVLEAISRNGLEDKVHFIGYISESKLAALFTNASLFVFPSKAEGFGLPPLEAMSHGTAVAASNVSCIPEILGDTADYFNPDDPDEMMETIAHLLRDEEHRQAKINLGLIRAADFTWEKCGHNTLNVYREVLHLRPADQAQ